MEKIKIGVIVNTHGLKGEVKIKSFSDFNELRYQKGNRLWVVCQGTSLALEVESSRIHKGMMLVVFKGLNDINLVEKYRGCEVFIDKEDLHDLAEDEVYFFDLMGCEVFFEDGERIGMVEDVLETGANAVLRVNKKVLIPYVNAFIKEADIPAKKIIVYRVEGLL
ncbi:MAG: ribosome maturation factor RimM [Erysipelotrichia bacterium]|nr:ribosome maturation factor RimM [Erysipelotrichia bacterium]NCC54246.1 ribosome maturation factor RimM [Erysipelotrichia bacterium]